MTDPSPENPKYAACFTLLQRTGARQVQVRYHDDEEPVLWLAYGEWPHGAEAAGGLTPFRALFRLVESVVDGGRCAHCGKPSGITEHFEPMPLDKAFCWWQWDPETELFRRSCEGETQGRALGWNPKTGQAVGRNDPCPCGSGRKWKKCHGQEDG